MNWLSDVFVETFQLFFLTLWQTLFNDVFTDAFAGFMV